MQIAMSNKQLKRLGRSFERLPAKIASYPFRYGWVGQASDGARLAFRVDGGIGDHVVAARFIRDLMEYLDDPLVQFDLYCKKPGLMTWLTKGVPNLHRVADDHVDYKYVKCRYHVFINAVTFAEVMFSRLNGVLNPQLRAKLANVVSSIEAAAEPITVMMRNHPLMDGYLGAYTVLKGYRRHNFLHAMAGIRYGSDTLLLDTPPRILSALGLPSMDYVTVSNGFDGEMMDGASGSATKVYPYFSEVVALLKERLPLLKFVQIGSPTSRAIPGVEFNLIGKTSIPEVAGIVQSARLHLDSEGGLVHLASAVGTRSCVLFGPTRSDYFGYESNINIDPPVCGGCWWMEKSWMSNCVRGDAQPACMYSRQPADVAHSVELALQQGRTFSFSIRAA